MANCFGGRCRIMVLLRKSRAAIVRLARGFDQRGELGERLDGNEDWADGQRRTRDTVRHPDGNRRGALVVRVQPDFVAVTYPALHENRLAIQRMPRIVNRDLLSVVGGM
jgi:hypothetical protein